MFPPHLCANCEERARERARKDINLFLFGSLYVVYAYILAALALNLTTLKPKKEKFAWIYLFVFLCTLLVEIYYFLRVGLHFVQALVRRDFVLAGLIVLSFFSLSVYSLLNRYNAYKFVDPAMLGETSFDWLYLLK
jgi:hypothetical protein